jgi:energy-coupling factor transport system ATP-binding protein
METMGVGDLARSPLRSLSGGQQQRVAIGSVLTAHPRVILLDEPTSALDPTGAEEVLATITRLVHDLAVTVVVAEHRVERVLHYADTVVHVSPSGEVRSGLPSDLMIDSDIASPVLERGRHAAWPPLPLSVRDARRAARGLRARLTATLVPVHDRPIGRSSHTDPVQDRPIGRSSHGGDLGLALTARDVMVRYPGDVLAVSEVDLDLHPGEVTALMGRNGCGKSSLLWALQGSGILTSGTVLATRPQDDSGTRGTASDIVEPRTLAAGERRSLVGMVPQTAADLLYLDTVGAECDQADRESAVPSGTCARLLEAVAPGTPSGQHPRDLSEGQKLALVLAVQLTADPPVLLLDEPTRGLDPTAKAALSRVLRGLARRGRSVVVSSPAFAPQVSKVTAPGPWLTVDDVRDALAGVAS